MKRVEEQGVQPPKQPRSSYVLLPGSLALAASMSMALPVSTPPNAMAYSRGEFDTRDMIRVSLWVSGVGVLAILFGGRWIMWMGGILE